MSETLYRYYEEELVGFRQDSEEFSERFPAAAGQLRLDRGQSGDPHVERLIESFAFLNARVRKKLDDDFPELTDGLLSILYPHFLSPIPSMTTVQFRGEPSNLQASGIRVDRHMGLHTQPFNGLACKFRTVYPVDLWPIEVESAHITTAPFPKGFELPDGATAALTLSLRTTGGFRFEDLSLQNLRFHFDGDSRLVGRIHELLFKCAIEVGFRAADDKLGQDEVRLSAAECLQPVGFFAEENIVPFPPNSFVGFQLLSELYSYPHKFAYADLSGFQQARRLKPNSELLVTFYVSEIPERLENELTHDTFRLGCTPIVNLFERVCEPIQLSHKKYRYKVTPDVHHPLGMEVYSINRVKSADPHRSTRYQPFYSFHQRGGSHSSEAYWYSSRDESLTAFDRGTDVYLHLVDPDFDANLPAEAALTAVATCSNRDLPALLQERSEPIRFELESAVPVKEIKCLQPFTPVLRAPMKRKAHWSLISHLTLNHLSITDGDSGLDALKQILQLYDYSDRNSNSKLTAINRQMVEGITGVSHRRVTRRIGNAGESAFCRGLQVQLELDEEKYIAVGTYLFATVMRHFFTKYASLNSFVELLVKTKQREEPLCHWPPLLGEESLS